MAASESGPMFLQAVNCEGEYKDKYFISNLLKEVILSVGPQNVVQVITDNAPVCRSAGLLIENQFPHIFWTPCVVHTLNLALKSICAAKNTQVNAETYEECSWITEVTGEVMAIKNFIVNHSMRLFMFNAHSQLKLLLVVETRFASSIIMLKRFKLIKQGLLNMVVSPNWANYREDDVVKASLVKEKILNDLWWDKIDYILAFTKPIYEMLRKADTDEPCLHLVYDWWDSMIENVKVIIYRHEGKLEDEDSPFYSIVYNILVDCWAKSNTPLHCLAHSLNPRYYSDEWLRGSPNRLPPHKDKEISDERQKCFEKYFPSILERREANTEFAKFSAAMREFASSDSISDRGHMDPDLWWVTYGSSMPLLQNLALKLLGQPCSSSCCERNWSTYSFINSLLRNKITPQRGEDLVFVHSNLRLLSRQSPEYKKGESNMWDLGGDGFDTLDDVGILEMAKLSFDEPEMEAMLFTTDDVIDDEVELLDE
ncbi:hAT transposon superfamily [Thalictrum thalictroides]|uniref:HAT transposon superfamily n=1 Tax=Thalictrum thalictroides TaxID=46969 RepID=A0A7J6V828_THATH|nr:hAT transposon superfamily [Thalictrum thalictroides]